MPVFEKIEITDDNAVVLACRGDSEAFSFLYEKNVKRIYNYIYYRIGTTSDAEDITSRVFYRAFGHIHSYVEKGVPFSAWLYRIAHNLIANWHRDNQRRKEVPLDDHVDLPQKSDQPERWLEKNQETELLLKGIRKVSADRQQLILLKYLENLSNAEIALIMGRSEGAIKSLYHRALISLREEMEKIGYQPE
ncbi:MAG: sigma-70 family RNA polymerase sigma factor [Chloroflexi bacterium]|nr:sigma-70 family RNA polymerase sigma factor [Chloroflexota bacterium]